MVLPWSWLYSSDTRKVSSRNPDIYELVSSAALYVMLILHKPAHLRVTAFVHALPKFHQLIVACVYICVPSFHRCASIGVKARDIYLRDDQMKRILLFV